MSSYISVALKMRSEDLSRFFDVRVQSNIRKGIWGTVEVDAKASRLEKLIATAAAAIAEQQNEKYGDQHNPDYCAKLALEAYHDCLRKVELNEAGKAGDAKSTVY